MIIYIYTNIQASLPKALLSDIDTKDASVNVSAKIRTILTHFYFLCIDPAGFNISFTRCNFQV